ncbi:MAG TPA: hydrogenase nickel incorporation protein HypB [Candidatus Limnocylindrales bacterium]|nr:hydrogenase nickel incorporation protein HypB [Candidatus Limnocylindrales bacterium]
MSDGTIRVEVAERVLATNDETAAATRADLAARRIFTVDLMGAPGAGKTALLEATLRALADRHRPAVLVGDLTTRRDGDRLARWCDRVVQISTGQGCHLEAHQVRDALASLDLDGVDLLVIENVGNLICPVGFDLGQSAKVGLFSITEGEDKAAKHPYLVREADLLLLNKVDLLPYLPFDRESFEADVRRLNPAVPVLPVSATTGEGLDAWVAWLERGIAAAG